MNKLTHLSYLCASLLLAGCNATEQASPPESNTSAKSSELLKKVQVLLIHNGDVITVNDGSEFSLNQEDNPAVLVADGVIVHVGDLDDVKTKLKTKYADNRFYSVKELDLQGKTLMPGFIEPHAHLQITAQAGVLKNLMPCLPTKYQQQLDEDYGWFYYPKESNGASAGCYRYLDDAIAAVVSEEAEKVNEAKETETGKKPWLVGNGIDPSRMVQKRYAGLSFDERLNKNKAFLNYPMSYIKNSKNEAVQSPVLMLDQSGHLAYANMKAFDATGLCDITVAKKQLNSDTLKEIEQIQGIETPLPTEFKLSCSGSKADMQRNQLILQSLCFEDGDLGITPVEPGSDQWQYSGLIKESSAYILFVDAMMAGQTAPKNVRGMIKHGAPDDSQSACPVVAAAQQTPSAAADVKLMNTMKLILNTSSQQGVTMFVEGGTTIDMKENYTQLVEQGGAYTRIRSLYDWRTFSDQQQSDGIAAKKQAVKLAEANRVPFDDKMYKGMFSAEGIKLLSDGSTQGCSANLKDDYATEGLCEAFGTGHEDYNQSQIQNNLQKFADCGWYFNIHANGDQAISDSVGALVEMKGFIGDKPACDHPATQNDYSNLSHTIIHSTVSHAHGDDSEDHAHSSTLQTYIEARKALPNLTPSHLVAHIAYWGASMNNELGGERGGNIDPMGDEKRAGIEFSMHSDLSISPLYPLWFIEQAVTRNTWEYANLDGPGQVLNEKQRIEVEDAIKAVTLVPAKQHNLAHKLGSIEVGKIADLIVLDQNPLDFGSKGHTDKQLTDIHDISVKCTFIAGKLVPWFDLQKVQAQGSKALDDANLLHNDALRLETCDLLDLE